MRFEQGVLMTAGSIVLFLFSFLIALPIIFQKFLEEASIPIIAFLWLVWWAIYLNILKYLYDSSRGKMTE